MDIESILVVIAALVALGYYIYMWYKKAISPESPAGKEITVDEILGLIKDPEFLNKLEKALKALEAAKKAEADANAVPQ